MTVYHRIATVEFKVHGIDQNVTVSGIPYAVTNGDFAGAEQDVIFDAIKILRYTGLDAGLDVVCIGTYPVREG
jgi:hypothetical protein